MEDDHDDFYDDETCPGCGDGECESLRSACIDDLCYGGEVPCAIHGDLSTLPCSLCGKSFT